MEERSWDPCQFCYQSELEYSSPDSRSFLRVRRVWWTLRKYRWYASVIGLREFNRRIFPSTRLGRLIFRGGKDRSRPSKTAASNIPNQSNSALDSCHTPVESPTSSSGNSTLNLKAGDWVQVKSAKEIFATLDEHGKHKGLIFSREMMKFCGKRFKVFKALDKICIETTGEIRTMKTPTVILEGVVCDGEFHGGCTRSSFHFWREEWLQRSHPLEDSKSKNA
ncbi:MAG: hypothetical protein ABSF82_14315 [Candidatus Bathyarchaeia archaeon]